MINSDNVLKRICKFYNLVENYSVAVADKENTWELHHKREIDENKSRKQLIDEGRYYDVEPSELIFLTKSEHRKLHNKGKKFSEEHKRNLSKASKESALVKERMHKLNESKKGKTHKEETKKKISSSVSKANIGKHFFNNGVVTRFCYECPEGFVPGRLKKSI